MVAGSGVATEAQTKTIQILSSQWNMKQKDTGSGAWLQTSRSACSDSFTPVISHLLKPYPELGTKRSNTWACGGHPTHRSGQSILCDMMVNHNGQFDEI